MAEKSRSPIASAVMPAPLALSEAAIPVDATFV
jgi:hypothetical protein